MIDGSVSFDAQISYIVLNEEGTGRQSDQQRVDSCRADIPRGTLG